jgi:hypothetical protein
MRLQRKLSIDELAERLALPRSTIYYWVRDLPIPGSGSGGEWPESARRKGTLAMQRKYRLLREEAFGVSASTTNSSLTRRSGISCAFTSRRGASATEISSRSATPTRPWWCSRLAGSVASRTRSRSTGSSTTRIRTCVDSENSGADTGDIP